MAERILVGAGVGSGVAVGRAYLLPVAALVGQQPVYSPQRIGFKRVQEILNEMANELEEQAQTATGGDVLISLSVMLRDPVLWDSVKNFMSEGSGAERAIRGAFSGFARDLEKLGGYFAERAADLNDLSARAIQRIVGQPTEVVFPREPFILVATELSPILASKLSQTKAIGVITAEGSPTSHSAIITRAANLPTVVGVVGSTELESGQELLLDATSGQVLVAPSQEDLAQYADFAEPPTTVLKVMPSHSELPVTLLANLGSSFEGPAAIKAGAAGVGLFRTELLYLGRTQPPTLDEQTFEYSKLLANFQGKRVVVRVLDIDVDKPLPFLRPAGRGKYANRGLRVLLENPAVLQTQLKALAKAAQYYPDTELWVMAPMVLNAQDAAVFVRLARAVGLAKVGIMVEVPEIAKPKVMSQVLPLVDFLSIGTNDLTQYVLGRSRHKSGTKLLDTRHPKVMRTIESVVDQAKRASVPVGICGESAADVEAAKQFISLGVSSLSASPALIPQLAAELMNVYM